MRIPGRGKNRAIEGVFLYLWKRACVSVFRGNIALFTLGNYENKERASVGRIFHELDSSGEKVKSGEIPYTL
jgi:hypothetical protein